MKATLPSRSVYPSTILIVTIAISGCAVPVIQHFGAKPGAIQAGTTSKAKIVAKFGYPDKRTFDGRFFLYTYSRDSEVWIVPEPFKLFGSYIEGRVLIEFDNNKYRRATCGPQMRNSRSPMRGHGVIFMGDDQ